jgi:CheY-like chemotaxis protein
MSDRAFRVLVVDDDADVAYLFERLLGGPPEVSWAADAREAVGKAREGALDLVFVDVHLLHADGMETLTRLKELAPDAVLIMMGGQVMAEEVEKGFALGAHDFLAKPFRDIGEIIAIERVARYCSDGGVTIRRLAREVALLAPTAGEQRHVKPELLNRWIQREALCSSGGMAEAR